MSRPSKFLTLGIGCLVFSLGGCATIVSEKQYPVTIENAGGPTYYSVYNRKREVVQQGITPQQVTLDAKAAPFWPAKYQVVFAGNESMSQQQELRAGFDPWVGGNVLIGGGLGAIVDGATGAMFRLPGRVSGNVSARYAITEPTAGAQTIAAMMSRSNAGGNPVRPTSPYGRPMGEEQIASRPSGTDVMPVSNTMRR